MRKLFLVASLFLAISVSSQSFIQAYQNRVNTVSQANINTYLTEFASYGVKTTGSTANANALAWLKNKYTSFGYTTSEIVEDPFSVGSTNSKNLVVTKTGTTYPNTFVIICGHFDTIAGPGVNDNGSGVSTILEIARILKNVPTEYSIKFINFSGEEQGLNGSQHFVSNVVNATNPKMDIKVVFNIDQAGGRAGQTNNTIVCESDQTNSPSTNNAASLTKTQELANCVALYSTLQTVFGPAYSSDYMPFQSNNEIITGFYEDNVSTFPHTANDTYANMDPVFDFNVAKAAVGAAQHFASASSVVLGTDEISGTISSDDISISPNPAKDFINIKINNLNYTKFSLVITDAAGRTVLKSENEARVNVSSLSAGVYFGTFSIGELKVNKKIVIGK